MEKLSRASAYPFGGTKNYLVEMTRTELVKKLTSYALVDEGYAASFMEAFLLLLHQQLLKSETFKLANDVSFKQIKVVRNNKEFFLINCSSTDPFDTSSEDLVFAVPELHEESKSDKYSVFSIGIGKQIIPSKEMIDTGFAFEPSFSLKNYCREKAANLLQKGEFISASTTTSAFDWDFSPTETEDHFSSDATLQEEISKEVQEFSWDFGTNWKRELQEDEILSVQPSLEDVVKHTFVEEPVDEKSEEEFSGWNFSEDKADEEVETTEEIGKQTKIDEVDFSKLHAKLNLPSSGYEFEEVKAKEVTQEFSIDLSDFEISSDADASLEEPESTIQADEFLKNYDNPSDEEYVHVQSTSEFVLTQEQEQLLAESDPFSSFTVEKTATEFDERPEVSDWQTETPTFPLEKEEEPDKLFDDHEKEDEEESQVKKEKGSKFWATTSALLLVIIFVVLYWKMWGIPNWIKMGTEQDQLVKIKPAVVEREYDVPVTYPYEVKISESPKPETSTESLNQNLVTINSVKEEAKPPIVKNDYESSDIFSKDNPRNRISGKPAPTKETVQPSKIQQPVVKESVKKKELIQAKPPETKKATLIRDNIYLEGSSYVVQLSSWKSESIADQEVARLKRKGINAFKTSALVPQKGGTWYRVKVGGFSSAEEASRFYNSNK